MANRGILSAFGLKLLMAALMLMDHIYHYIPGTPQWFTWLGRLVAPVFCFLMTRSMVHTSNRGRYVRRLAQAGLVMLAGNVLLSLVFDKVLSQNIFLSLAVSAGLIFHLERFREGADRPACIIAVLLLSAASVFCEGSVIIPVCALIFFYLYQTPVIMCVLYGLSMAALVPVLFQNPFPQILMIAAIVPILSYNGERGQNSRFARSFFYLFYPAHVWALFAINQLFFSD